MINEAIIKQKYSNCCAESFETKLEIFLFNRALDGEGRINRFIEKDFLDYKIDDESVEKYAGVYWQQKYDYKIEWKVKIGDIYSVIQGYKQKHANKIEELKKSYKKDFHKILPYELLKELLGGNKCEYCNVTQDEVDILIDHKKIFKKKETRGFTLEIDRKEANKEYSANNIVLCCYWCNSAKTDEFSDSEFRPLGEKLGEIWRQRLAKIDSRANKVLPNNFNQKRTSGKGGNMNQVFFDLSGTIINHETNKPIFFMPYLMKQMLNRGWKVSIISRYSEHQCRNILDKAGIRIPDVKIYSSLGSSKGEVLYNIIKEDGRQKYVYIDDKPENLEAVRRTCGNEVRIIGFVGSRKYTPGLSKWCFDNEVELALSPVDLCEGLPINVDFKNALADCEYNLSLEDIAALIPGLDHPMSPTAGETDYFEHRYILGEIFDKYKPKDYKSVWLNMGWISCEECLWKALVETVIRSLGFKVNDVLPNLDNSWKYDKYTSAMKEFCANSENQRSLFHKEFHRALDTIKKGIKEIGSYAERCRIASKKIELNRIEFVEQMVNEVFGREE